MSKKILTVISRNHPWYAKLKSTIKNVFLFEELDTELEIQPEMIIDLTICDKTEKHHVLKTLNDHFRCPLYSDLTYYWQLPFFKKNNFLKGALCTDFTPNEENIECNIFNEEKHLEIIDYFQALNKKIILNPYSKGSFVFPKVISMIVNEAYFSLEDGLANVQDINRAMKYGTNYPKGPFEFCEMIGAQKIAKVLFEEYCNTNDPRYKIAPLLTLESY